MKNFIQVELFVRGDMVVEASHVALTLLDCNIPGVRAVSATQKVL